ncbi:diguanylate cyclase [Hydrogenophaga defluvii]|uniref:diguanylate cyclase n=1 Tax=Hydrogenophaga defluvii TaxID=249410 RepID=A0ABW2SEE0_9BURK
MSTKPRIPPATAAPAAVRRWRIGSVLLWLVLACLLPGMVGTGVMFALQYREGRAQLENDMLTTARALVRAVDNQLLIARASALSMAASDHLATGDLTAFHAHAREVLMATGVGMNVVISDPQGQQLLNTLKAPGEALPHHGNLTSVLGVLTSGQAVISSIYTGGVLGRPVLSVDVPVWRNGQVHQVLSLGLLPHEFDGILASQRFPEEQLAAIFDAEGTIAARTIAPETYVGQKGVADFIARIRASPEGIMTTITREGVPTLSAWSRSLTTGWSVGIGIAQPVLERHLKHKLGVLGLVMVALLALGLLLAWLAARRIADSLQALRQQALALREGAPWPQTAGYLSESAMVSEVLHQTARQLATRAAELDETHRLAGFGVWRYQPAADKVTVSESVSELLGRDVHTFRDLHGTVFDASTWAELKATHLAALNGSTSYEMEVPARRSDGQMLWLQLKGEPVRDALGQLVEVRGSVLNITSRKEAELALEHARLVHVHHLEEAVASRTASLTTANEALQRLSHTDVLTQLNNRLSTNERLRQEFLRMKRHGQPYAVLFIDIDRFKRINDTYGHETGDEVLRQLARVLQGAARVTDFVARYGGEEFLVLLPDTTQAGALTLGEKIRQAVATQTFPVVGEVTVSVGVSEARGADKNEEEAVHRADKALYRAKSEGRNRVCCD